jgi:hypothetical protein
VRTDVLAQVAGERRGRSYAFLAALFQAVQASQAVVRSWSQPFDDGGGAAAAALGRITLAISVRLERPLLPYSAV